ncbi:MAG: hypothetical protein IJT70_04715 [Clostridia bacterium]|nr:hypothetical protein [Clostridia bacterium]
MKLDGRAFERYEKEAKELYGETYSADARFNKNTDCAGGQGTAKYATEAIRVFCGGNQ